MRQRSGGMVLLAISVVAGLLAAILGIGFLRGVTQMTNVVVANQEIAAFTELNTQMFTVKQVPASAVPADAVTDLNILRGRYARTMLLPGMTVQLSHLATSQGQAGSLAAKLAEAGIPGARAMAIPVDNTTAAGGMIAAGDKVDILASIRLERQGQASTQYSKTIAHGVPVLLSTESDGMSKAAVVVMVGAEEAEDIALALMNGTIHLVVNPFGRSEAEETIGVTPDTFYQKHINGR